MLCLGGFELYSHWVPLLHYYFGTLITGCLVEGGCLIAHHFMEVQKYIIYQNSGCMDGIHYVTLYTLGKVLRETVVLLSLSPDVSVNFVSRNIATLGKTKLLYLFE